MPKLALDDDQRHALTRHLDGVRVAQPVRREPSSHAGLAGDAAQLGAGGGGRPRAPARGAVDDAEQRPDRQLEPGLEPGLKLFPWPPLPRRTSSDPRRASRSASARASAPQIRPATAPRSGRAAAGRGRHRQRGASRHDLLDRRRIRGIAHPLLRAGRPAWNSGSVAASRASDGGRRHRAAARTVAGRVRFASRQAVPHHAEGEQDRLDDDGDDQQGHQPGDFSQPEEGSKGR
jgi:hypothetical protein